MDVCVRGARVYVCVCGSCTQFWCALVILCWHNTCPFLGQCKQFRVVWPCPPRFVTLNSLARRNWFVCGTTTARWSARNYILFLWWVVAYYDGQTSCLCVKWDQVHLCVCVCVCLWQCVCVCVCVYRCFYGCVLSSNSPPTHTCAHTCIHRYVHARMPTRFHVHSGTHVSFM